MTFGATNYRPPAIKAELKTTNIEEVSINDLSDIALEQKQRLSQRSIENARAKIVAHVQSIVPPAKTPNELKDDIRAALAEYFSDFSFGEIKPRIITEGSPYFNNLVHDFQERGLEPSDAREQATDSSAIVNRINAGQSIFETPVAPQQ